MTSSSSTWNRSTAKSAPRSASSASAMSACRLRSRPGPPAFKIIGFDIDPRKSRRDQSRQELHQAHPGPRLSTAVKPAVCAPPPISPTWRSRRDRDLRADAARRASRAGPDLCRRHRAKRSRRACGRASSIVLESTTYPGTTTEVMQADFRGRRPEERAGFLPRIFARAGRSRATRILDTRSSPRSSAATTPAALELAERALRRVVVRTFPVSSTATAEAVKLTENIFRAVNIALVNELKIIYDAMGIDVWEVIEAAKTKPFGFMPFYPGPGPRRPLHSDRPVLSDLEGARIRAFARASSNSPARSTRRCRAT